MRFFKYTGKFGRHVELDKNGEPGFYNPGDVIATEKDLARANPDRFTEVTANEFTKAARPQPFSAPSNPLPTTIVTQPEPSGEDKAKEAAKVQGDHGKAKSEEAPPKEVTDKFPEAVKAGLQVFQSEDGLFSLNDGDSGKQIAATLANKAAVDKFVKSHMKAH